jgi:hypothetical protein
VRVTAAKHRTQRMRKFDLAMNRTFRQLKLKPGDIYESCSYHPVLCLGVDYRRDEIWGVSLSDGSYPRACSLVHCRKAEMGTDHVSTRIFPRMSEIITEMWSVPNTVLSPILFNCRSWWVCRARVMALRPSTGSGRTVLDAA